MAGSIFARALGGGIFAYIAFVGIQQGQWPLVALGAVGLVIFLRR